MPADELYWNPMELESDESVPYPKQYIDPWDLENYAYIRQHLDSVDLNSSDPSSLGEQESSGLYHVPGKYEGRPRGRDHQYYTPQYDSLMRSEHGTSNYAAIDELTVQNDAMRNRRSSRPSANQNRIYSRHPDDYDFEHPYEIGLKEEIPMQIYESHRPKRSKSVSKNIIEDKQTRNRSRSFSNVDYEYDPYAVHQQPIYHGMEDIYVKPDYYDSTGTSPIYDDIRTHRKPRNFKLSNYGHLEIDYSFSWNNLNNYIYN